MPYKSKWEGLSAGILQGMEMGAAIRDSREDRKQQETKQKQQEQALELKKQANELAEFKTYSDTYEDRDEAKPVRFAAWKKMQAHLGLPGEYENFDQIPDPMRDLSARFNTMVNNKKLSLTERIGRVPGYQQEAILLGLDDKVLGPPLKNLMAQRTQQYIPIFEKHARNEELTNEEGILFKQASGSVLNQMASKDAMNRIDDLRKLGGQGGFTSKSKAVGAYITERIQAGDTLEEAIGKANELTPLSEVDRRLLIMLGEDSSGEGVSKAVKASENPSELSEEDRQAIVSGDF